MSFLFLQTVEPSLAVTTSGACIARAGNLSKSSDRIRMDIILRPGLGAFLDAATREDD
jgi:hypothetical protein